jgi:hypothetical protein
MAAEPIDPPGNKVAATQSVDRALQDCDVAKKILPFRATGDALGAKVRIRRHESSVAEKQ